GGVSAWLASVVVPVAVTEDDGLEVFGPVVFFVELFHEVILGAHWLVPSGDDLCGGVFAFFGLHAFDFFAGSDANTDDEQQQSGPEEAEVCGPNGGNEPECAEGGKNLSGHGFGLLVRLGLLCICRRASP